METRVHERTLSALTVGTQAITGRLLGRGRRKGRRRERESTRARRRMLQPAAVAKTKEDEDATWSAMAVFDAAGRF